MGSNEVFPLKLKRWCQSSGIEAEFYNVITHFPEKVSQKVVSKRAKCNKIGINKCQYKKQFQQTDKGVR